MSHDGVYKLLFSHPQMVRDLLTGYVPGDWIKDADFSTLEQVNGSYVSDSERQRHDDMVWRVRVGDRWLWVYLILEFQSESDPWMAVRVMVYFGLLAQNLIRQGELYDGRLPPILPIVLYNGRPEWNAACNVADCFVPLPVGLEVFRPRLLYHLVDEARLMLHPSDSVRNFSAALFSLEQGRSVQDLRRVLQALDTVMRTPELWSLRRAFGVWVRAYLRRKVPVSSMEEVERINDIMEADRMLAERMGDWFDEVEQKALAEGLAKGLKQGREQGREEGIETGVTKGRQDSLLHLLSKRFGDVPPTLLTRLELASLSEIEVWFDRAINASSLADVFRED